MTKRPFTSGSEGDLLACTFFRRDWVGVQCTGYKIEKNARVEVIDLSTK